MPMRSRGSVLGLVAILAAVPTAAYAKRPGSHFPAEVAAGACLSGDAGPSASVAFGRLGRSTPSGVRNLREDARRPIDYACSQ